MYQRILSIVSGLFLIALMPNLLALSQEKPCGNPENPVTETGTRVQVGERLTGHPKVVPIPQPGSRYMRFRLQVENPDGCNWYLTIRDSAYHVIQTLTQQDFKTDSLWTNRVPDSVGNFELINCSSSSFRLTVVEYIAMPDQVTNTYYSLKNWPNQDFKPLYEAGVETNDRALGDYVGFFMSSWGRKSWSCSGVFVAPNLFLTNWHCGGLPELRSDDYWNKDIIRDTIIDLSWDDDAISREYMAVSVKAKDEPLDFAILEVQPINMIGIARAAVLSSKPIGPETVKIVQHPAARKKQISNCQILEIKRTGWRNNPDADFSHRCDTEAGSSGSPVFNGAGQVVGLHHLGFALDDNCHYKDDRNKAVRMDKIIEFLTRTKNPVLNQLTIAH